MNGITDCTLKHAKDLGKMCPLLLYDWENVFVITGLYLNTVAALQSMASVTVSDFGQAELILFDIPGILICCIGDFIMKSFVIKQKDSTVYPFNLLYFVTAKFVRVVEFS